MIMTIFEMGRIKRRESVRKGELWEDGKLAVISKL